MGYFKQQEIASHIELGDRLPAPKPAISHVANQVATYSPSVAAKMVTYFPTRRLTRQIEKATARQERCRILRRLGWTLLGLSVGVLVTVAVVV